MTNKDKERFWSYVEKGAPTACWPWKGGRATAGYGKFWCRGKTRLAHRVAYALLKGRIPKGRTLDHLCRVRHCVNPAHTEPVSLVENVMRGVSPAAQAARKTTCKRGHPLSGDNLYIVPGTGYRQCRRCQRVALHRWYVEHRQVSDARSRAWAEAHPGQRRAIERESKRRQREAHREEYNAYMRAYYRKRKRES